MPPKYFSIVSSAMIVLETQDHGTSVKTVGYLHLSSAPISQPSSQTKYAMVNIIHISHGDTADPISERRLS